MKASIDLEHLPIFPLPNALLFPNAVLPLHVFEPRYRQMVKDALAGGGSLAIACFDERGVGAPPVRRLVGVGAIVAHEALPEGRSNILLRGLGRARIVTELGGDDHRLYRVVRAEWVPDEAMSSEVEIALRQTIVALANRLAEKLPEGGATLRSLVATQSEAGGLTDLLCAALVTEPQARLRMFDTLSVSDRADGVVEAIAVALATLGGADSSEAN